MAMCVVDRGTPDGDRRLLVAREVRYGRFVESGPGVDVDGID